MRKTYFIDQTSLVDDGFIVVLEKLLIDKDNIDFIIDSAINTNLDRYESLDEDKYFYLKTILIFLDSIKLAKYIDASDFCEPKVINNTISGIKGQIFIVSQRMSTFRVFTDAVKDKDKLSFLSIVDDKLSPVTKLNEQNKKPFYVSNDSIYINKVDTSDIKYVYAPKYGYLKLFHNHINSGGEGTCYPTYKNLYCKIFNEKHLTYVNYKKIAYMMSLNIDNDYLAWPKDLLYYKGDFVGYAMNFVTGAESLTNLKDSGFEKYKSPLDRARICLAFLNNIKYLHDRDILVGDLKDDNVLVKSADEVYIIDCGSFQVDDFACDVFTKGWTDKEYHRDDLNSTLRVLDDEYYPINRLIFELMILKNPYYSPNNLEVDGEGSMDFKFPLNIDHIDRNSPPYLIAWAMLSPRIREFFYYFFKFPNNRKIIYIEEWIDEFKLLIKTYEQQLRR
ncbi:MAG: hypothetical protein J6X50_00090 [Bacilli bacterium]|nr:hypothetical protein [Bacilli bacterium]